LIPFNVLIWSYGIFILSRANPELKIKPVKIFINAGTVPCFIGFILFILRVRIYAPVLDSMTQIGAACTPLSMFIVGAMLVNIPIKRLLFTKETWLVILVKNLVIPLGVGVLMRLFGFSREISYFCALMASLPTAAATAMFAESYDIRPDLAAQSVGLTTVISLGTTPFAIWLLSRIFALI
ncbi:MAG: AEC family transporter, partial [Firmicutes bacterium]|nr:AEC family transporter [Candidatus Colimorpha enterica]